jgi:hypothetical protein
MPSVTARHVPSSTGPVTAYKVGATPNSIPPTSPIHASSSRYIARSPVNSTTSTERRQCREVLDAEQVVHEALGEGNRNHVTQPPSLKNWSVRNRFDDEEVLRMTTYVLVGGGWLGGWCWQPVARYPSGHGPQKTTLGA